MAQPGDGDEEELHGLLARAAARLKIFPLAGAIVFPGTPTPLHVFEPRYRAMVGDALETDRMLAVASLLDPAKHLDQRAPVEPIAGAGFIEADEKLADGTYNIVLRGLARVRLVTEAPELHAGG